MAKATSALSREFCEASTLIKASKTVRKIAITYLPDLNRFKMIEPIVASLIVLAVIVVANPLATTVAQAINCWCETHFSVEE